MIRSVNSFKLSVSLFVWSPSVAEATLKAVLRLAVISKDSSSVSLWLIPSDRVVTQIQNIDARFQEAVDRVARRADNWFVLVE